MVLVTGATGFVGKEIIKVLRARGEAVRALVREPKKWERWARENGVEMTRGDVMQASMLGECCQGVDAVIHLVGIIAERGKATFENVHVRGTQNIIRAAQAAGVRRFIHMSALGTRADAVSNYHKTKWQAEESVRQSGMNWTIFRPSLIYGAGDQFVNMFAAMLTLPVVGGWKLPCIGDGRTRLQPVGVDEVAECFVQSIHRHDVWGGEYDLAGEVITFSELLQTIARSLDFKPTWLDVPAWQWPWKIPLALLKGRPVIFTVPFALADMMASVVEKTPFPLLTRDQVQMLREHQNGNTEESERVFRMKFRDFEEGIGKYKITT